MSKSSTLARADMVFLLAAATATLAAILMVTVWAPLQIREFERATTDASFAPVAWTNISFQTDRGNSARLADSNGQVRIVTMLYTHCPGNCPLSVSTLQSLESRLAPRQRAALSVVALTLDPEHDTLDTLNSYRTERHLDSQRWILGRASATDTRAFGSQLGLSYRSNEDGTFDHQSAFVLLDRDGKVLARTSHTNAVDQQFLASVESAL